MTCLRFPTACGMSPNLRLDLVINDFVFSAINKKKIKILSDGTPWRPIIHFKDMAKAIEWSLKRKKVKKSEPLCINVGNNKNNFKVIDMALKIKKKIKGISVSVNKKKMIDKRSYQVSFDWFLKLAPKALSCCPTIPPLSMPCNQALIRELEFLAFIKGMHMSLPSPISLWNLIV